MENKGKILKQIRLASKFYRQSDFAKELEITVNYLSQLENNHRKPSIALLAKLEDKFGPKIINQYHGKPANSGLKDDIIKQIQHDKETVLASHAKLLKIQESTVEQLKTCIDMMKFNQDMVQAEKKEKSELLALLNAEKEEKSKILNMLRQCKEDKLSKKKLA